jgi:hypothetical protein
MGSLVVAISPPLGRASVAQRLPGVASFGLDRRPARSRLPKRVITLAKHAVTITETGDHDEVKRVVTME